MVRKYSSIGIVAMDRDWAQQGKPEVQRSHRKNHNGGRDLLSRVLLLRLFTLLFHLCIINLYNTTVYLACLAITIVVNGTPAHQCTAQYSQPERLENGMPVNICRARKVMHISHRSQKRVKKKTQGLRRARDLMYIRCISFSPWLPYAIVVGWVCWEGGGGGL